MCGILGVLHAPGQGSGDAGSVDEVLDLLEHRGPDDVGTWTSDGGAATLGHRRLSIVDLSPTGHQPMASSSGRYVTTYNGEIYNHPELRAELEDRGHGFRGTSDTETLLQAVEEWGLEGALERCNGMFAFGLWDDEEGRLHLARDRTGQKPLVYGRLGDRFLFASELTPLAALAGDGLAVDRSALADFLRYKYIPYPGSIAEAFRTLPPASILTLEPGDVEAGPPAPRRFWDPASVRRRAWRDRFQGAVDEAADRLDEVLGDAVDRRTLADVPVGAFLSGGIDSSLVVALMQARSEEPVRTFTIGFEEDAYDEADDARAVAEHLGTEHHEMTVSPEEAMDVLESIPDLYDEPFADPSQVPTYIVSRFAREHVKVGLTGDGGDELFGGYGRYVDYGWVWRTFGTVPGPLRRAVGGGVDAVPSGAWGRLLGALGADEGGRKARRLGRILRQGSALDVNEDLLDNYPDVEEVVRGLDEAPPPLHERHEIPSALPAVERMMYLDAVTHLPGQLHTKIDRASMGTSLEARAPFMDHRVVELAWSLPTEMKIRDGVGKWILRRVLERHVPRDLWDRPKTGFDMPWGEWVRGPLEGWAEGLLDRSRLEEEGFLDPDRVRERWEAHRDGRRDGGAGLWAVLMFQLWLEENPTFREAAHAAKAQAGSG